MNASCARVSPLVVSYGAGVDSTALLVEFVRRQIRPDYILFADTGGEPRPGSITAFIRQEQLLFAAEIEELASLGPRQISTRQQHFQHGATIPPWSEFLTAISADPIPPRALSLPPTPCAS